MEDQEFIANVYQEVIIDGDNTYRDLFNNTRPEEATHPYFKVALPFFNSLSEESKETFFAILKQTAVDTISSFLAVIDGVLPLKDQADDEKFSLSSSKNSEPYEFLQDTFLGYHEYLGNSPS